MFSKSALLRTLVLLFALAATSRVEGVELTEGAISRTGYFTPTTYSLSGPGLSYSASFDSYWWHRLPPCNPCFLGELRTTSNSFFLDTTDFYSASVSIDGQTYYNWGSFYDPPPPYAIFSSSMNFVGGLVEVPFSDEPELILVAPFTMTGSVSGRNRYFYVFGVAFNASGYASLHLKRSGWSGEPAYMYHAITYRIATRVDIDVKPGEDPAYLNLSSHGKTPIAILSTATFDAGIVDPISLRVAGAPVSLRRNGTTASSLEDVNGDGLHDLVVQVSTEAIQLTSPNQVLLEGYTVSGKRLWGTDEIVLVP